MQPGGGRDRSESQQGARTRGGPTVPDSKGGVIRSRLCDTCAKLWRLAGQPNPWVPTNKPGGSSGAQPKQRKPVGMGV